MTQVSETQSGFVSDDAYRAPTPSKRAAEEASHALHRDLGQTRSKSSSGGGDISDTGSVSGSTVSSLLHGLELFGEGLVSGAILKPINGIEQIVNQMTGAKLPALEFSNQSEVDHSVAGRVGEFAGAAATMLVTDGAVGALGAATKISALKAGSALSLGVTGAIQGGILTPSDASKTATDFLTDRLGNAGISALTLATMGGVSKLVPLPRENVGLGERLLSKSLSNVYGGLAGGIVSAEGQALKNGQSATRHDMVVEVAKTIALGVLMGAGGELAGAAYHGAERAIHGDIRPSDDIYARVSAASSQSKDVASMIDLKSAVTPRFMRQLVSAAGDLKPSELDALKSYGVRITTGESIKDIDPSILGQKPAGWKSGTWENSTGFYDDNNKIAVVTEKAVPEGDTHLTKYHEGANTTRHELGHAMDYALGAYSQTPDFAAAHQADIANLSPRAARELEYYIQPNEPDRGANEAFAEIFAAMRGGGSEPRNFVLRSFPNTMAVIEKKLKEISDPPHRETLSAIAKFRNRIRKRFD